MKSINPYLDFNGTTEEAFNFYKSIFGGEFTAVQRWKDMPGNTLASNVGEKIMHISLPIGNGTILMGTDTPESMKPLNVGNNFYITINPDSKEEANKLFNNLSNGGKVEMPMQNTFWGAYYGAFKDKFGIQ